MGNEQPKAPQKKQLTQFQVDVACLKVKGYVELHRDRRTNQALMKEKNLNEMLRQPTRAKVDEYQKFQSLVQDVRFIETCNIVIRYSDIIKDQSIRICQSNGDASKIGDVMPYIESILFAADNLNLQQVVEFKDLMVFFFGPGLYDTNKLLNVDPDMKKLYKNPLPDAFEINEYVIKFATKYGFSEDQINAVGHQFSSKFLQPSVGGIQVNNSQGYQGGFGNQPNQQQFGGPGSFPQSYTGGNGFGNDFPPPNGGFGNQSQGFGNNQNGFNGGNHNDFGGYGGYGGNQQPFNQPTGFQPLPPPNQGGNTGGFGGNPSGLGGQTGGLGGPTGGLGGNPSGLSGPTGGYGGPTNGYGGATGGYGGVGDGFGGNSGGYGGATGGFGGNTGGYGGNTGATGGFGGNQGGFGTPQQMGPSQSNPYANLGTPYQAQTQAPPIMASLISILYCIFEGYIIKLSPILDKIRDILNEKYPNLGQNHPWLKPYLFNRAKMSERVKYLWGVLREAVNDTNNLCQNHKLKFKNVFPPYDNDDFKDQTIHVGEIQPLIEAQQNYNLLSPSLSPEPQTSKIAMQSMLPSGVVQQGQFVTSSFVMNQEQAITGKGVEQWPDNTIYEGQIVNGKKEGKGKVTWPLKDGATQQEYYEGDFKNNQFEGFGIYQWADGKKYEGKWKEGKRDGYGVYQGLNQQYQGEFKNDLYHGQGTLIIGEKKLIGLFENGKLNGDVIVQIGVKKRKGIWKQGKFQQWIN